MTHIMNSRFTTRWLVPFVAVLALTSTASAGWKEKVLYSFQGGSDGSTPAGGVVFDKAGNLYGATTDGGADNCSPMAACGTVYQLAPPAKEGEPWTETVLRVFKGKASNDGEFPAGRRHRRCLGQYLWHDGLRRSWRLRVVGYQRRVRNGLRVLPAAKKGWGMDVRNSVQFKGGNDGYNPYGDLVFDNAGNIYGSTDFGGGKGTTCDPGYYQYCGTVFKLSPPKSKGGKWTEQVLHSFAAGTDGANPNGGLVLDSAGDIFGTTVFGGSAGCQGPGCGTAFELKKPTKTGGKWTEKILHVFTGGDDGASPDGGLVLDAKGTLYGTGGAGGTQDSGVVFQLTQVNGRWAETVLHSFQGTKNESDPQGLVADSLGNLYCSTGSIVQLKPPKQKGGNWRMNVLYTFNGAPDGRNPLELIFGSGGALYGTTLYGGTGQSCEAGCGTVFEAKP